MHNVNSIDVVIPSFRLNEEILLGIFDVDHPVGFTINFYVVADNPGLKVPASIVELSEKGLIILVVNQVNLGFAQTRNKGIMMGKGKWLLLLDDDIVPDKHLLTAYADAIAEHRDAIGFAGVTNFPETFNSATRAMELHGLTGHFKAAKTHKKLMWVPTANVMLNRDKMDPALFNESLNKGGEDIEFLVRNVNLFGEQYISVPLASVTHPWWDNGAIQTERQFRYGVGAAQIAATPTISPYTYHDFTNTVETLLLLLLASPFIILNCSLYSFFLICLIFVGAEFLTNATKAIFKTSGFSLGLIINLFWLKNCYEAGYLYESIRSGRWSGFAERIEMGFVKKNPSWFRLNKWKIIKTCLIIIGLLLATIV
ncbi:glycosyltransferase family 2 protein [Pedobacter frigoris]|uniref:Glycosyltransferase family 2 protein n=1 Tax=Pedobacter frigoris TaxID=2571272 RepID=A0A4U1CF46_9SPHI|nr:glycosyltransferase family A protein [Pedobacter frigoris]TKC02914.1 glycosyltransferase family 2 protein [Pedobacter frigoris]